MGLMEKLRDAALSAEREKTEAILNDVLRQMGRATVSVELGRHGLAPSYWGLTTLARRLAMEIGANHSAMPKLA